ncbi:MAG: helix-turn-helix transcriptional regulator [Clostridia bacterium]|nr:helix-turn-helix transcriptional regulator [Clostridia bacterium]
MMSKIKDARLNAGLTQDSMSQKLGIPKRTIQDWESDRRTPPDYVERLVIAELERIKNNISK